MVNSDLIRKWFFKDWNRELFYVCGREEGDKEEIGK